MKLSILLLTALSLQGAVIINPYRFTTTSSAIFENPIVNHLAQSASTTAASSYATVEDFTEGPPRANALLLAWVVSSKATTPDIPTFSGFNVTWLQVGTVTFNSIASPTERLTLFWSYTNGVPAAKPGTATFSANQTGCAIEVMQFENVATNFTQTVTTNKDSTTNPAIPFATPTNPGYSLLIWGMGDSTSSASDSTPPTGWAEERELAYGTPSTGLTAMWQIESPAGNSASTTATSRSWAGIMVEVQPNTYTPTAGVVMADEFIDFENSTDGTTMTTTILNNGTHGSGSWTINPSPLTTTKVKTGNQQALNTPVKVGATTYTASGDTRTAEFDFTSQQQYIERDLPDYKGRVSWGGYVKWGPTNDFVFYDSIVMFSALDFGIVSYEGNGAGTVPVKAHTQLGTSSGQINLTPNHWYYVTQLWNYGYGTKVRIYDPSSGFGLVDSEITLGWGATLQGCNVIDFGRFDNHGAAASTKTYFDNIAIDWTHAKFPLGP